MLNHKSVSVLCIIVLAIILFSCFYSGTSCIYIPLVIAVYIAVTAIGSFHIRWNYYLKAFHKKRNINRKVVAITFDDGPNSEFTPKVLDLLKQYNAKATFFCIGKDIESHSTVFQQIIAEGHTVGNHTYSHPNNFGFLSTVKVITELERTNQLVEKKFAKKMLLYRPAFGVTNPRIAKAVKRLGLTVVGWSVRSLDTTKRTKEQVLKRVTNKLVAGDIILLHDTSEKTIWVLEQLLLFLKQKNLQSVSVDKLLEIKAYA